MHIIIITFHISHLNKGWQHLESKDGGGTCGELVRSAVAGMLAYVAKPGRRVPEVENVLMRLLLTATAPMDTASIASTLATMLVRGYYYEDARNVLQLDIVVGACEKLRALAPPRNYPYEVKTLGIIDDLFCKLEH